MNQGSAKLRSIWEFQWLYNWAVWFRARRNINMLGASEQCNCRFLKMHLFAMRTCKLWQVFSHHRQVSVAKAKFRPSEPCKSTIRDDIKRLFTRKRILQAKKTAVCKENSEVLVLKLLSKITSGSVRCSSRQITTLNRNSSAMPPIFTGDVKRIRFFRY